MNNKKKRNNKKIVVFLVILTLFIFMGCQSEPIDKSVELTDEETHELYHRAREIYSWFSVGTLPADLEDKKVINGRTYFKVEAEFSSYEAFINELNSYFDKPIVNDLLSRDIYTNIDGELYGVLADRGTDIYKGDESYEIIRESDDKIIYRVSVEELNDQGEVIGHEIFEFPLKYYEDDQWRFTSFEMVR